MRRAARERPPWPRPRNSPSVCFRCHRAARAAPSGQLCSPCLQRRRRKRDASWAPDASSPSSQEQPQEERRCGGKPAEREEGDLAGQPWQGSSPCPGVRLKPSGRRRPGRSGHLHLCDSVRKPASRELPETLAACVCVCVYMFLCLQGAFELGRYISAMPISTQNLFPEKRGC